MPELFDTHAHLDQAEFDADRKETIERARAAGVKIILAVGATAASSAACLELAEQHPDIYAAVGIQPNYCARPRRAIGTRCWPCPAGRES